MCDKLSIYESTAYFPAGGSGPAAVLGELLLPVRQPGVLANQHDHRHERGEQSVSRWFVATTTQRWLVLLGWFPVFPKNCFQMVLTCWARGFANTLPRRSNQNWSRRRSAVTWSCPRVCFVTDVLLGGEKNDVKIGLCVTVQLFFLCYFNYDTKP